jgi:hypothetical protein
MVRVILEIAETNGSRPSGRCLPKPRQALANPPLYVLVLKSHAGNQTQLLGSGIEPLD